jgi:hypothetical protein
MSKSHAVSCLGCDKPFTAGRSLALHHHWHPECLIAYSAVAMPPSNTSIHHPTIAAVSAVRHRDHGVLPLLFASSTAVASDESVNADCEDDSTVGDDAKGLIDDDNDLHDVFSFPQAYTKAQKYEVELLKIIHSTGAPNGAFESIMSWAQSAVNAKYDFQPMPKKYVRQIHHLERFVGMSACRPTQVSVSMFPHLLADDKLDVVVFDFPSMLASLFNCPLLNKNENLVVNPNDRFGKYVSPDGRLGEVNSGQWYDNAYTHLVTNPSKDFLCPIIFTMDKTVISEMGGLNVYVILFTTSIFNRQVCFHVCRNSVAYHVTHPGTKTRNKALAWRPLAYIPCEQYYSQKQYRDFPTDTKMYRLFQLYEAGLASYVKAQKPGAMDDVYLPLGDKGKVVNMLIPLAFIIGDNQGGDGIAGRAAYYGLSARRISRNCDATVDTYATIEHDCCSPLNMEEIKALVDAKDWKTLYNLHQVECWNPFFDVCYGGNPGGIFTAACPAEALHALENGIFPHSLKQVLGGCLKPKQISKLDSAIQAWTNVPRQKAMRSTNLPNAPRLLFKDGISNLANCSAATKVGQVFALVIGAITRDGKLAFYRLDDDEYHNIIYAFEQLLCYWAWLKKDFHWTKKDRTEYDVAKKAIAKMLQELVNCMPRLRGNGWDIPKMHEQLHVASNIYLFGSHKNIHTGPTERNHIDLSKKPAQRTQMRKPTFDWQVSNRLVDKMIVDLAMAHMSNPNDVSTTPTGHVTYPLPYPSTCAFFDLLIRCQVDDNSHIEFLLDKPNEQQKLLPPVYVLEHLATTCFPENIRHLHRDGIRITCFTELQFLDDSIVRSNRAYKDGPWFDYMNTKLEDGEGKPYWTPVRVELMYYSVLCPEEQYAVVHPAFSHSLEHSVLTTWYRMEYMDDPLNIMSCRHTIDWESEKFQLDCDNTEPLPVPRLRTVKIEDFSIHQLMIHYHNRSKFMIGVLDQHEWADEFLTQN